MRDETGGEPARDPQDLERLLVSRERDGDVDGMVALYESDAVIDCGEGQPIRGIEAIRAFFIELVAQGRKFELGDQRPALVSGDLALTSTRSRDGSLTAEIARRQSDGTWLWVIDKFSLV
jgi:ketosteroid isomerase-like protein